MTIEELKQAAIKHGFDHVGYLDADTIEVHKEARDACAENKCKSYNKTWNCPPGCGTLEECEARIRKFKRGLILETTCVMEDAFDYEAWGEGGKKHKESFDDFAVLVRREFPGALILGDGACKSCKECTYPDAPCRFPEKLSAQMEAYGMIVSEVCQRNDIKYYWGPGTVTFVGCVLVE